MAQKTTPVLHLLTLYIYTSNILRIVVRERDNAALGVFTNSNERFGNTFFGDSLFDLDIDEPLVQPIGLRSYNVHMPKKEWTPCIGRYN